MVERQQLRRLALIGSLFAFAIYWADVLIGKFATNADSLSEGLFSSKPEVLVLFTAVILLLVGAALSDRHDT